MKKNHELRELISVIVPIYNVEIYLQKCINTVINQSYTNLEIILVDDGSTDYSGKLCDEVAKKDNRIVVIHKKNGGLSDARNAGLDIAKGRYISFIDSDDYIALDYIEKLYSSINKTKADVAICSFSYVDENDSLIVKSKAIEKNTVLSGREVLYRAMMPRGVEYVVAWNKLYKREIFDNLRYDKGRIHEDEFINYKLFWKCNRVVVLCDRLYFYRQRQGSIQNTQLDFNRIQTQREMHESRIEFYRENGDELLSIKALQSYFNWATRCFATKEQIELIPREYRKLIQREMQKNLYFILKAREINLLEKGQDIVAALSLKFAGRLKTSFGKGGLYEKN